ncbi:RagB/SusD family nutrient uptake outer membrane protein [uncultured Fibrella sp.]|uniref:RagB/SusD family nutrient uptake outer membrane protein n=1 Tax=uncultured Fibrella sp. TaxID=1284596 RepID=UPI0035C98525
MKFLLKYGLLTLALLAGLTACEVERLPETSIADETFWRTETDLRSATNYLYTFLPGFGNIDGVTYSIEDVWSDDAYGKSSNGVSDGSRLPSATAADYNSPYRLIRAANNILEKAPRALATTLPAVIDRYSAEARFFRAWAYFALVQKYGDVPLILNTLTDASPELQNAPSPRASVLDQVYQDLDFAASKLPTPTALGTADYGRVSNVAALAVKARVALFEGTRSKFHQYGDATKHLTIAVAAAKAVMDSKEHDLYTGSYFNLFQMAGEGRANRENVLVRQYGVSTADRVLTHSYFRTYIENGALNPTKALADTYLMKDGLPITKSPLYTAPASISAVFTGRDSRMSDTFEKAGDLWTGTTPFVLPNLGLTPTGFAFRKYQNVDDWISQASLIDRTILRYAEVLLIYAEATYELNNTISDADLDLTVNRLRARGGVAKLSNAFVAANSLVMRDELRRERRVELAQEGFRYWDLIRWKTAEIELPKAVLGNYFFKSEFGTSTAVKTTADNYLLLQDTSLRKFDPNKDYLWPFPINELALNQNLKQNKGW